MWQPIDELHGYCMYSSVATTANSSCKTMRNYKSKIIKGIPQLPDGLDGRVHDKMSEILKRSEVRQ